MTSTLRPSPSAPIFTNLKIQATRSPRSKDTPENARMARRPQNWRQSLRRFLNSLYYSHIWTLGRGPLMLLARLFPDGQYDKKSRHGTDSRATLGAGVHRIY